MVPSLFAVTRSTAHRHESLLLVAQRERELRAASHDVPSLSVSQPRAPTPRVVVSKGAA